MSRNEKLIAMFDSVRSENKGDICCNGVNCGECPFRYKYGCYIAKESACFNLDKAIEIIDNYELPIKEYTLEELENLPKGTMVEVQWIDEMDWLKREFIAVHKDKIIVMSENGKIGEYIKARPIQEVK